MVFAGSEMGDVRATAMMSLLQSVKLNGYDPLASLIDILTWMPSYPNNRMDGSLPNRWVLQD